MAQYEIGQRYRGSGVTMPGLAGETIPRGAAVFMSAVDGLWYLADSDAAATMPAVGIVSDAGVAGNIIQILVLGLIERRDWTWTRGDPLYISGVGGVLTQVLPAANAQVVGVAITATLIFVDVQDVVGVGVASGCPILEGSTAYVGFDECKEPFTNYFLVDGVADDVQINAAEAYVTALGGGTVELERGTYALIAPIIPTGNEIWYKGQGPDTFLDGDGLATTEHAFHLTARDDIHISDMSMQTENGGGKTSHCIFIEDGSDRFLIKDVTIVASDSDGIHIEGTTINQGHIHRCLIESADGNGILVDMDAANLANRFHVKDCDILNCGGIGISFAPSGGNEQCEIVNNVIYNSTGVGLQLDDGDNSLVQGNISIDNGSYGYNLQSLANAQLTANMAIGNANHGLRLFGITGAVLQGNLCFDSGGSGISVSTSDNCTIVGNTCNENSPHGITMQVTTRASISGNVCNENVQSGINLFNGCNENSIVANACCKNVRHGIWIDDSNNNTISGNTCNENDFNDANTYDGINITDISLDNIVHSNTCNDNDRYGINIDDVRSLRTWVKNNELRGNTSGPFNDDPANLTKLATLVLSFVEGTTLISAAAPFGWEIDANTEFALALGHLPDEVQETVRWKIWATSLVADADAMRLEIEGYGGASDEPYNTETVAVANHPSETTNFAINDVIFWLLDASDDADIDDMVGGDQVMIKVLHEAAGGDDVETDATFTCVEIEYV